MRVREIDNYYNHLSGIYELLFDCIRISDDFPNAKSVARWQGNLSARRVIRKARGDPRTEDRRPNRARPSWAGSGWQRELSN